MLLKNAVGSNHIRRLRNMVKTSNDGGGVSKAYSCIMKTREGLGDVTVYVEDNIKIHITDIVLTITS